MHAHMYTVYIHTYIDIYMYIFRYILTYTSYVYISMHTL